MLLRVARLAKLLNELTASRSATSRIRERYHDYDRAQDCPSHAKRVTLYQIAHPQVISNGDYGIFLRGAFSQVFVGAIVLIALLQGAAWLFGFKKKTLRDVK